MIIAKPGGAWPSRTSSLNLNRIESIQDTIKPGKDEILLGAVATVVRVPEDDTLDVDASVVDPIDLGKLNRTDFNVFSPARTIASFGTIDTPVTVMMNMVLAEDNLNGHKATAVFGGVTGLVVLGAILADTGVWFTFVGVLASLLAASLVAILALAVAELFLAIVKLFLDEIFPLETKAISLDAAGNIEADPVAPFTKRFARQVGIYDLDLAWAVASGGNRTHLCATLGPDPKLFTHLASHVSAKNAGLPAFKSSSRRTSGPMLPHTRQRFVKLQAPAFAGVTKGERCGFQGISACHAHAHRVCRNV